jgi:hypothetical protein
MVEQKMKPVRPVPGFLESVTNANMASRAEDLTALVLDLIEDKIKKAGGDIDLVIVAAKEKKSAETNTRISAFNAAQVKGQEGLKLLEKERSAIVTQAFREGLRPSIQGTVKEWTDTVTLSTDYGDIEVTLSDFIIDRASEFKNSPEETRSYLIRKYAGFGHDYVVHTKDGRGSAKIPIVYVAA